MDSVGGVSVSSILDIIWYLSRHRHKSLWQTIYVASVFVSTSLLHFSKAPPENVCSF